MLKAFSWSAVFGVIASLRCLAVGAAPIAPAVIVNTDAEPMVPGKFQPTWDSLQQYQTPDWFRDAKFGIWAHWGPQCEPEMGDWFARGMYEEGSTDYKFSLSHYGPQSVFGFKDVIHQWKAQNWDPEKLVSLYKRAGAQYFFALANHHDNFDLWDSTYQPWNATKIGPQKNLIAGWAKAAHDNGLKFGVSVHASHAWTWYEPSQRADTQGPYKGIPYDGKLTAADGKGKWWEGLDPQDLYAQNHPVSAKKDMGPMWDWGNGASQPDQAYCEKFYNRVMDLIKKYQPDLVYFDDNALPLWPVSDAGLKIAANYYNLNMQQHGGKLDAVIFGKSLSPDQRKTMVWDIERGQSNTIEPQPWQTDTCIGNWHYDRRVYEQHHYKSVKTVIQTLCDVVSKNGNLLLNIPVRGDGTIDDDELHIVQGIADWMDVNRECIFGTRPWKILGEGPAMEAAAKIKSTGFNEGKGKPFTAADVRFTIKSDALYAIIMGDPTQGVTIKSLGTTAALLDQPIANVELLGGTNKIAWKQTADALSIEPSADKGSDIATVFKISLGH